MKETLLNLKILLSFWDLIRRRDFVLGETVRRLEKQLADFCGATYALGVGSGTDALILSLKACGVGPGDEVITAAVGFFSTAGAISWVNATPVFVDADADTFNIGVSKIEAAITSKTKAIVPVHLNGRMVDMEPILALAKKYNLFVIVDAAQAIGSKYKDKPIGQWGDLVCLSFGYSKILETYGDGGMIFTNRPDLAEKIALFRTYGAPSWKDIHTDNRVVGVASRLGSFQAAVVLEKLPFLTRMIERQRTNYFLYNELLKETEDITLPCNESDYSINGYRLAMLTTRRDELQNFLSNHGEKLHNWYPVPLPYLPAFQNLGYKKGDFPVAEKIADECLILPTRYNLPAGKGARITNLINEFFHARAD